MSQKVYSGGIKTCATMPTVKVYNGKNMVHIPVSSIKTVKKEEENEDEKKDYLLLDIPEISVTSKRSTRVSFSSK